MWIQDITGIPSLVPAGGIWLNPIKSFCFPTAKQPEPTEQDLEGSGIYALFLSR